jgi:bacterial/archaeal transporter family protein
MAHLSIPSWCWPAAVVLLTWGAVGLLQKLSTNYLSAESALIWLVVGYVLLLPWLYSSRSLFTYPIRSLVFTLASAVLNTLGAWALLAAMKNGGKASIVVPFTALYPLVVVVTAPAILHESINLLQGVGVLCALASVVLLST